MFYGSSRLLSPEILAYNFVFSPPLAVVDSKTETSRQFVLFGQLFFSTEVTSTKLAQWAFTVSSSEFPCQEKVQTRKDLDLPELMLSS